MHRSIPNGTTPVTRAAANAAIGEAGTGHTRVLIVGDPGIGKSTLLDAAAARFEAAGVIVLRANPSFAERYTAHSMLWDLLADVDWRASPGLSDEYRAILEIALGRKRAATELPALATAIALENILLELTTRAPLALLIDDVHWADAESRAAVERSVRRLAGSRVSLIASGRVPGSTLDSMFDAGEVHTLGGLAVDELEVLVRPSWPSTLTPAQVVAVHEHTGGNPMWALELIGRGAVGDLGALPVGTVPAPLSLAATAADRLRSLSTPAADVVSIIALLGRPRRVLLTNVMNFIDAPPEALDEAETAGFLAVTTETASIRHPIHASAAAARLRPARRRELNAFIARAVDDPVKRAQHLQQSAPPGPDEVIAAALTQAAVEMRARGARLRSAHFDAQAVERTAPNTAAYQDRLLNQAQHLYSAGDHSASARALALVPAESLDAGQYDAYLALSTSSFPTGSPAAGAFLAAQAGMIEHDSARLAMVTANAVTVDDLSVSERARMSAVAFDDLAGVNAPNARHRALRGTIRSRLEAGAGLDHALIADLTRRQSIQIVVGLDDTGLAATGFLAHQIDDVAASRQALGDLAAWARTEGKEGVERAFLAHAALVELVGGDVAAARQLADRAGLRMSSAASPVEQRPLAGFLLIAAGRHEDLAGLVDGWRRSATDAHQHLQLSALLGFSALGQRNWHDAVTHLRVAARAADSLELVEPGSRFRVDLALIEALLQTGQSDEAGRRQGVVGAFLAGHDRPISRIGLHRVTSLRLAAAGDLTGALISATAAVEFSATLQRPADHALALLQRARVLQRMRRVTLARADLQAARDLAADAGSADLRDQVAVALATARPRRDPTELTAAQTRVHTLVRAGHSNREIAAQLYLSVRTVESHIAVILRKSGAASRAKLITRQPMG